MSRSGPRVTDLSGREFGRWTVVGQAGRASDNAVLWACRCSCGNQRSVRGGELTRKGDRTRSCGCLRAERRKAAVTKHGQCTRSEVTSEYAAWSGMLGRCGNPNHKGYPDYGGRGITVCARWRQSFANFFEDMGRKPSPEHSIDRIDNDRGYSPDNCRWATQSEQMHNFRRNNWLTFNGETLILADWCRRVGVSASRYKNRLYRGWSPERAMFTPLSQQHVHTG